MMEYRRLETAAIGFERTDATPTKPALARRFPAWLETRTWCLQCSARSHSAKIVA